MITIIHGDDTATSRNFYHDLKQKEKNLVLFSGIKVTLTDLIQNIQGSTLFQRPTLKTIAIEEFLTKFKKTNKESKEILDFIVKNSKDVNFVLWESKEISKRDLLLFKEAVVKNFKLSRSIFSFLDNLKPNNSNQLLNLLHQTIDSGVKEELILFMMQRQFRLLLSLCHPERSEGSQIDEVSRLAPWQAGKLEKQATLFSELQLKQIYKKLYKIEFGYKTGSLSLSLPQAIDFLLLEM